LLTNKHFTELIYMPTIVPTVHPQSTDSSDMAKKLGPDLQKS